MTVQELITQLQQFDPNMEVRVKGTDPTDWEYQNEIECVVEDISNWEDDMDEEVKIVVIDGGMF